MDNLTPVPGLNPPAAAHYRLLLGRIDAALHALAEGEIDAPTFRRRIDGIQTEMRALELCARLCQAAQRLAAKDLKASKKAAYSPG
ncbi:MAG: hypothetical protein ACLGSH_14960 [Acidobacteriota bacterium]